MGGMGNMGGMSGGGTGGTGGGSHWVIGGPPSGGVSICQMISCLCCTYLKYLSFAVLQNIYLGRVLRVRLMELILPYHNCYLFDIFHALHSKILSICGPKCL